MLYAANNNDDDNEGCEEYIEIQVVRVVSVDTDRDIRCLGRKL